MRISAAIITHNAVGQGLERCLASLSGLDEVVVFDQGSDDGTVQLCERFGARVYRGDWEGFGRTKQAAVMKTRNRWVLSIDADEEITPELKAAILALGDAPECAAYAVNRLSSFLGRWMRHCGWHPDWVVRLFDKERARFNEKTVHEEIVVQGATGRLDGLLRHHAYDTMEQYVAKLNRYTTLAAGEALDRRERTTLPGAVLRAKATFARMYFLQRGFLDGWHGLVLCLCSSFYVLTKYLKIWRAGRP